MSPEGNIKYSQKHDIFYCTEGTGIKNSCPLIAINTICFSQCVDENVNKQIRKKWHKTLKIIVFSIMKYKSFKKAENILSYHVDREGKWS